jgi:hypothetical protein
MLSMTDIRIKYERFREKKRPFKGFLSRWSGSTGQRRSNGFVCDCEHRVPLNRKTEGLNAQLISIKLKAVKSASQNETDDIRDWAPAIISAVSLQVVARSSRPSLRLPSSVPFSSNIMLKWLPKTSNDIRMRKLQVSIRGQEAHFFQSPVLGWMAY